jgi:hypothetical protein
MDLGRLLGDWDRCRSPNRCSDLGRRLFNLGRLLTTLLFKGFSFLNFGFKFLHPLLVGAILLAIYEIGIVVLTDKFKTGILEQELWIDAG